jgi:hypothetical protein
LLVSDATAVSSLTVIVVPDGIVTSLNRGFGGAVGAPTAAAAGAAVARALPDGARELPDGAAAVAVDGDGGCAGAAAGVVSWPAAGGCPVAGWLVCSQPPTASTSSNTPPRCFVMCDLLEPAQASHSGLEQRSC